MSMLKFLVRRTLQGLFVVWAAVTVMFVLREISPGDPATMMLGEGASQELIEEVREAEGLNEPLLIQYFDYFRGLVTGDLGYSWIENLPVETLIWLRLGATLELAVAATIVALVIAIPLGVVSATRRGDPADYGATLFSLLGISTPNFWLGIMLVLIIGVWYGIPHPTVGVSTVSTGGYTITYPRSLSYGFYDLPTGRREVALSEAVVALVTEQSASELWTWIRHIILPAITLGTYFTALITRLTRSGMIDELGKPYVTATEAKGLPGVLVRYKHVLRNTMIPIVTVVGLQMGTLMGGAIITETVFAWDGLGLLLIDALDNRDWPLLQGIVVFIAIAFVFINIVVDAIYTYLDPEVSLE